MHRSVSWKAGFSTLVSALLLLLAGTAEAYVYVGDGTHIVRANNDGTGVDLDWLDSGGFACGVAVTPTHIYWGWLGGVGRANIDGTSPNPNFVVAPVGSAFCGVAVGGAHLYWADRDQNRIGRVGLDGTSPNLSFANTTSPPCGLAADSTRVYWSPLGSGPVGAVLQSNGAATPAPPTGSSACSVAAGPGGIYYSDRNAAGSTQIGFVQYDGTVLGLGLAASKPCGIAVTSSQLLWVNEQAPATVGRAPLNPDLSAGTANQNLITGLADPCGIAVDDLPTPPPPGGGGGVNSTFTIGKATLDKKKGTAKLRVTTTGAGALELSGDRVKRSTATLADAGSTELAIKAAGKAKKALRKKGKAKISYTVEFTPASGSPSSVDGKLRLKRKR